MAEQPLVIETKTSVLDELEKLAEGFERRNFHFVSLCLTKIVRAVAPRPSLESEQTIAEEAVSIGGMAELHKTVKALDVKEFHLAAVCFRKALAAYNAAPPTLLGVTISDPRVVTTALDDLAQCIAEEEFSSAASHIRRLAAALHIPEHPREFVTEQPAPEAAPEVGPVVSGVSAPTGMTEEGGGSVSPVAVGVAVTAVVVDDLSQEVRINNLHERLRKLEESWEATHAELQVTKAELHQLRAASAGADVVLPERSDIPPIV